MIKIVWVTFLIEFGLSACSYQAWQHSSQEMAKHQCDQAPGLERERCLSRLKQQTQQQP